MFLILPIFFFLGLSVFTFNFGNWKSKFWSVLLQNIFLKFFYIEMLLMFPILLLYKNDVFDSKNWEMVSFEAFCLKTLIIFFLNFFLENVSNVFYLFFCRFFDLFLDSGHWKENGKFWHIKTLIKIFFKKISFRKCF